MPSLTPCRDAALKTLDALHRETERVKPGPVGPLGEAMMRAAMLHVADARDHGRPTEDALHELTTVLASVIASVAMTVDNDRGGALAAMMWNSIGATLAQDHSGRPVFAADIERTETGRA